MPLTIRYKDQQRQHETPCDPISEKVTRDFIMAGMIYPQPFDFLIIDLSNENCEEVHCYQGGERGKNICSFGGASAWNIYKCIATVWPEIDYYLPCFEGRPARAY